MARGIIAGVFQAAYVYTPEVYPTTLRSIGVGSCSAMARLGAMITPYVAQVKIYTYFFCKLTGKKRTTLNFCQKQKNQIEL